jgi:hypothetical protein
MHLSPSIPTLDAITRQNRKLQGYIGIAEVYKLLVDFYLRTPLRN